MAEQTKQKLKYWIFGLITGGAVSVPITSLICKSIFDRKAEQQQIDATAKTPPDRQMDDSIYAEKKESNAAPDISEINNYDLSIDDEEASEEARERTEAHERYLDMIDKYNGNNVLLPRVISSEDFENEQFMQKAFVNWYEEDDVFEENLSVIEDPYMTFGVTSGKDLFANSVLREDPEVCYVRNERTATDYEISRVRGSYAAMVGGESCLGETDT